MTFSKLEASKKKDSITQLGGKFFAMRGKKRTRKQHNKLPEKHQKSSLQQSKKSSSYNIMTKLQPMSIKFYVDKTY